VAFPESVVEFFRGALGQPHGGFPPALQRKVLKGTPPLTQRPGATLPAGGPQRERARIQERLPRPVTARISASYLMYPRVWLGLTPRSTCCTGIGDPADPGSSTAWSPGQEISVDLERARPIVRYGRQQRAA